MDRHRVVAVLVGLAIDLLIGTLRSQGGGDMMGMASTRVTPGIGAFVNLAAAVAVAVAGLIKGREEKLF